MSAIRILSRSEAPFRDRDEAGELLARELAPFRERRPVVLGIPRGGVVVAARVAAGLGAELDVVLARKIGAPGHAELAVGAVAEDGHLVRDDRLLARLGVTEQYLARQHALQVEEIARRTVLFRAARPKVPLAGRVAIVVDDGLATGATMEAAAWAVRRERPERIVVAVPVGAADSIERVAGSVDELLCLRAPEDFGAVGRFFVEFDQTPDDEVVRLLAHAYRGGA